MEQLRKIIRTLSPLGIGVIILAPILAGGIIFALSPVILSAKYGAQALVDVYPITGTRASYEVATTYSNLETGIAAAGDAAAAASGQSSGAAAAYLTTARAGDSSIAQVSFQAPTREGAEAGLRTAIKEALTQIAQSAVIKTDQDVKSAKTELDRAIEDAASAKSTHTERDKFLAEARKQRVTAANDTLATAYGAQATAQNSVAAVPALLADTRVAIAEVSNTSDALRMSLAGALSALLLAIVAVVALRRRLIFGPESAH